SWASAFAVVPLASGVAAAVALGTQPADPLTGRAAGRYATIGLRWTAGSSRSSARPVAAPAAAGPGRRLLVLRARPGERVELVADWTGWQPVPVSESEPGVYAVEVRVNPGTYRFAFLVNGEWT